MASYERKRFDFKCLEVIEAITWYYDITSYKDFITWIFICVENTFYACKTMLYVSTRIFAAHHMGNNSSVTVYVKISLKVCGTLYLRGSLFHRSTIYLNIFKRIYIHIFYIIVVIVELDGISGVSICIYIYIERERERKDINFATSGLSITWNVYFFISSEVVMTGFMTSLDVCLPSVIRICIYNMVCSALFLQRALYHRRPSQKRLPIGWHCYRARSGWIAN